MKTPSRPAPDFIVMVRRHGSAVILYFVLTLAATFPLWMAPSSSLPSISDPQLNSYLLAWDCWAFFHQLGDFFQTSMFWPVADTLAYGEHLIAQAVMVLPAALMGGDAALLHNLSLMQAFFFSALAAYALAWRAFRSIPEALLAGALYGFAPYRLVQTGHVQLVHGEFLPLMILGFERVLATRGEKGRWLLGLAALAQWLTSWYWTIYTFWTAGVYMAGRLIQSRRALDRRTLAGVFVPLILAALALAPVAVPYVRLARAHVLIRPPQASAGLSATPLDWLAPAPRSLLYGGFQAAAQRPGFNGERYLFHGLFPMAGLALGAALAMRRRRGRGSAPDGDGAPVFPARLWLGVTALALSFCFGTEWMLGARAIPMPLALAAKFTPVVSEMRAAARWALPAWLGVAMLAAWAASRASLWFPLRLRPVLWGAVLVFAILETLARPLDPAPVPDRSPGVFEWLEEQPFPSPAFMLPVDQPRLLLDAAWHHQPIVNGSNGYFPPGHWDLMRSMAAFPEPEAVGLLRERDVSFVIVDISVDPLGMAGWRARLDRAARLGGPVYPTREFPPYLVVELPDSPGSGTP